MSTLSSHERVSSHGSKQPRASSPRLILMRRFGIALLGTCLVAAVGGCGGGTPPPRIASEPLQTCGELPPQIGTGVPLQARLVAPDIAASGTNISVRIRLTSSQKVRTPAPSQVVRIVRNGDVVGKYVGAVTDEGRALTVTPDEPVTVKRTLQLLGCTTSQEVDYARPNASRSRLPSGDYALVAVVTTPSGQERSTEPEPIHIAAPRQSGSRTSEADPNRNGEGKRLRGRILPILAARDAR